MTDRGGGCSGPGLSDPKSDVDVLTAVVDGPLVGTRGVELGSKPGAIRRSASRLRRSFSSLRARRYASRCAACAASVDRRASSTLITRDSSVNGYTNFAAEISCASLAGSLHLHMDLQSRAGGVCPEGARSDNVLSQSPFGRFVYWTHCMWNTETWGFD